MRDSRGAVGPPSKKEQIRRVMNEQPSPARTTKLRNLGFVPRGKSPGRTTVRSTGGPGARIASKGIFGAMDWTFGMPVAGALGLAHDVQHPVGAMEHPLRVGKHLAQAGAPIDEAPLALTRALRLGGAGARFGQYIHRGPEHTGDWTAERGPGGGPVFRDAEGNIVSKPYPLSRGQIGYKYQRSGGESRLPQQRPNDYFLRTLEAYGRYKSGNRYIWGWPDMNIVPAQRTVRRFNRPAQQAEARVFAGENLNQKRQAQIDALQSGGDPAMIDYDHRTGQWYYPYKGMPHNSYGDPIGQFPSWMRQRGPSPQLGHVGPREEPARGPYTRSLGPLLSHLNR